MEGVLVWKKRNWGTENVGEFLSRKRHVTENCSHTCLGKVAPCQTKFCWIRFCGKETARVRKKASMVDWMKAARGGKIESGGSFGRENGTWRKNACKVVGGKPPGARQNSAG
ncbi:hypothetical protein T10_8890 [Trichinella papuae]|uniref:Uncharacterized protein n=1 Tax=Trichinella papuae TaxID=268474 RepID=A0A0V1M3W2_9BILA|nr:hypothetical protein T10_8890 [Trichinella papuae]